ncbi:MAG: aminotransferase class V-fold PLP-dependent enzyme [candidate division Zixibacteria bacterium]|nr:aminotransferase class V-fold PLP-dependent enzyme [candidate division Zixibacteria bacterium]
MEYTRREFLTMVSAATALAGAVGVTGNAVAMEGDDPLGVRADFPAAREGVYLNSPYMAPSPIQVVEAGKKFLDAKARNPIRLGDMLNETEAVRRKFARMVGAAETEIGILTSTSEGENIVINSLDLKAGDNLVTDDLHYVSSYVLYNHLRETRGVDIRIVASEGGTAPADRFADKVDRRTRLVSVAWVSHQNGYRHDLSALADLAHAHDAFLYADAIQGIGMLAMDVKKTAVDFFTTGTYKWLLSGYGVAPFFVPEPMIDRLRVDRHGWRQVSRTISGHEFELHKGIRKFEYATPAFVEIYQLSAALDYIEKVGVDRIESYTVALAHRLHKGLTDLGFKVWTPMGNGSAIVAFEHGRMYEGVKKALDTAGVQVSFREENKQIRVGPALFNNAADVDQFLGVMASV